MIFDNVNDLQMYMCNSLVFIQDEYVYVDHIERTRNVEQDRHGYTIMGWSVDKQEPFQTLVPKDYDFPNLPFKGGNVVLNNHLYYISRLPVRRVRTGLTNDNMNYKYLAGDPDAYPQDMNVSTLCRSTAFRDLLYNKYQSVDEAINTQGMPSAFSRCFSLDPVLVNASSLRYRKEEVGEVVDGKFYIYNDYSFVADILRRTFARKGANNAIEVL